MPASIPACRRDCHSVANLARALGLWSVHTHSYRDVARASPPPCLYPGFGLLLQQSNPTESPGSPPGLALLPSRPAWTGQGVKPQPLTPPPRSRGFIGGDLLMKTRPQSPSVWSSLPETGISFTAPSRPVTVIYTRRCQMRPRGGAGSSPLACRMGRVYFKVTGALRKQSLSVGDQRETPHPAPKSSGFGKPKPPGAGLLLTAVALLTCSPRPPMPSSGWDTGSRLGHRVPGTSALMHGAGTTPSITWVWMASLLGTGCS